MADRFSGLRCRPGDLALIVQDEPECRANIGQIVRVIGEYKLLRKSSMFYWLVVPQSSTPSAVLILGSERDYRTLVYDSRPRNHPDAWLRPLRDSSEADEMTHITERPIQSEWKDPAHLRVT